MNTLPIRFKTSASFLAPFFFYTVIVIFSSLTFISLISFFHFLLRHPLPVIEDWLFNHAWSGLFLVKLVSLLCYLKLFSLPKGKVEDSKSVLASSEEASFRDIQWSRLVYFLALGALPLLFLPEQLRFQFFKIHPFFVREAFFLVLSQLLDCFLIFVMISKRLSFFELVVISPMVILQSFFLYSQGLHWFWLPSAHFLTLVILRARSQGAYFWEATVFVLLVPLCHSIVFGLDPFWYERFYSLTQKGEYYLGKLLIFFLVCWPFLWKKSSAKTR